MDPVVAASDIALDTRPAVASTEALRIELFNDLAVTIDGETVPRHVWGRRHRARVLLAMLIVARGRLPRTDIMASMWPDSPSYRYARNSLGVALCTIRQAIRADARLTDVSAGRALILEPNSIVFMRGPGDTTDIDDVRNLVLHLTSVPRIEYEDLLRKTSMLLPIIQGRPLEWLGGSDLAEDLEARLTGELTLATKLLVEAWSSNAKHFGSVPSIALETARIACDMDPTDEPLARRTMELHATWRGAAAASQIYHSVASKLRGHHGLPPSLDLSRRHAEIIAGI